MDQKRKGNWKIENSELGNKFFEDNYGETGNPEPGDSVGGIPVDARYMQYWSWDALMGEAHTGPWHRTDQWLRRSDGLVGGLVTICKRVYTPQTVKITGDNTQCDGVFCAECFPNEED